ncbi:hypothetical protein [Streptomyces palmae]|uniref:hypothetical protein n=1 Tax=Streptomyces palmae TaxID=1701085 RepID=UPI003CC91CF3
MLFGFVVRLLPMTFGMYGRVGHALPHGNPNGRGRRPGSPREEPGRQDRRGQVL